MMMNSQMISYSKYLIIILIFIAPKTEANWLFGPDNYAECMAEKLKDAKAGPGFSYLRISAEKNCFKKFCKNKGRWVEWSADRIKSHNDRCMSDKKLKPQCDRYTYSYKKLECENRNNKNSLFRTSTFDLSSCVFNARYSVLSKNRPQAERNCYQCDELIKKLDGCTNTDCKIITTPPKFFVYNDSECR